MKSFPLHHAAALGLGLILLSACASGPDRRGADRDNRAERTAQIVAQPVALYLAGLDADQDKRVTRSELQDGLQADWQQFDRPPSAVLFSNWALAAFGSKAARPSFISFDTDLDGTITKTEFIARLSDAFDRLDQNKDGTLTRAEMISVMEGRGRDRQGGQDEDRRLSGPPPGQRRG